MCKLVPVLRVIGFVFLVLAILACAIGFVAPFWIRLPLDDGEPTAEPAKEQQVPAAASPVREDERSDVKVDEGPASTTVASSGIALPDVGDTLSGILKNGSYEGLWAKCFHNLTCSCFWQDNFAMERAFPVWHYVVQGLFGVGLIVLLIALKTASFHVCCCHCCRDSYIIATVIGSMTTIGLILITLALAVYGAAASIQRGVLVVGDEGMFDWAYYTSLGGVFLALLAAILFLIEGQRGPSDSDGDGEETAKMV